MSKPTVAVVPNKMKKLADDMKGHAKKMAPPSMSSRPAQAAPTPPKNVLPLEPTQIESSPGVHIDVNMQDMEELNAEIDAMINIPLIPIGDRVLVEVVANKKSAGGIELAESMQVTYGIVRSIGNKVEAEFVSAFDQTKNCRGIVLGDKIWLPRGLKTSDIYQSPDGRQYMIIPVNLLGAILS